MPPAFSIEVPERYGKAGFLRGGPRTLSDKNKIPSDRPRRSIDGPRPRTRPARADVRRHAPGATLRGAGAGSRSSRPHPRLHSSFRRPGGRRPWAWARPCGAMTTRSPPTAATATSSARAARWASPTPRFGYLGANGVLTAGCVLAPGVRALHPDAQAAPNRLMMIEAVLLRPCYCQPSSSTEEGGGSRPVSERAAPCELPNLRSARKPAKPLRKRIGQYAP